MLRNNQRLKGIVQRSCSTLSGINEWDKELSLDIKLRIENHWQNKINKTPELETKIPKNKYFVLSMFPYPSGKLHMGHVRVYSISDSLARYYRMCGKDVIHPMGWDAFGLPAENAAIERKCPPKKWTLDNIENMKNQLNKLGCSFDWSREVTTCDPAYYKWTQYLFIQLHKAGLVYQKESLVNWDPVDQTVLADEQVDMNGCSWRSGAKVEKKPLKQWFVKTTKYAKALYDGLSDPILDNWRDIIKLQKHWIGECNGVVFDFQFKQNKNDFIIVWTSYPEFVEYATFIAVAPNSLVGKKSHSNPSPIAINPFTKAEIPIIVTNEVEYPHGADSYLCIAAASELDTQLAQKFNIPIKQIKKFPETLTDRLKEQEKILEKSQELNCGGYWCSSKLRDWLISRQRYWGTPIPIIHCPDCGPQIEPNLPVTLPEIDHLSTKGNSVLKNSEWINTNCPNCGQKATRETDTMDTFVDSSWYYLRFMDSKNTKLPFGSKEAMNLAPVDLYIGGKEHATLHLYYARFVHHFLHDLGLVPEREPFKKLLVQGMVNGRTYRLKGTGKYITESEIDVVNAKKGQAVEKSTGNPVVMAWEKMSKSKHNGVDPELMFNDYGVDTTRLLILADVAPTSPRNWNSSTFPGILNWQNRLWLTLQAYLNHRKNPPPIDSNNNKFNQQEEKLFDSRNYYIKGVHFNLLSAQQLSVAISKMQGLTNTIRQSSPEVIAYGKQFERALAAQLIMLAPMAPHYASELWSGFISAPGRINGDIPDEISWNKSVLDQSWPQVDLEYKLTLAFMVNGTEITSMKLERSKFDLLTEANAFDLAYKEEAVVNYIKNRKIVNVKCNLFPGCDGDVNIHVKKTS